GHGQPVVASAVREENEGRDFGRLLVERDEEAARFERVARLIVEGEVQLIGPPLGGEPSCDVQQYGVSYVDPRGRGKVRHHRTVRRGAPRALGSCDGGGSRGGTSDPQRIMVPWGPNKGGPAGGGSEGRGAEW